MLKTSDGCTSKKGTRALLDKQACPELPLIPFLKALTRFCALQIPTLSPPLPLQTVSQNTATSISSKPPPLEPSEKMLNAGNRKWLKKLRGGSAKFYTWEEIVISENYVLKKRYRYDIISSVR